MEVIFLYHFTSHPLYYFFTGLLRTSNLKKGLFWSYSWDTCGGREARGSELGAPSGLGAREESHQEQNRKTWWLVKVFTPV